MKTRYVLVVSALSLLGCCARGHAMATEQVGPDPPGRPSAQQPGWPEGIAKLARHPSRVYSIWVNGNEQFYFEASPKEINELLTLFGQVRMRDHEIQVRPGRGAVSTLGGQSFEHNVTLQVVAGIALAYTQAQVQKGKPAELPLEPRLTIYAGEDESLLRHLDWPTNAIIVCQVPGVSIPSPQERPQRSTFHGELKFKDGSAREAFVRNGVTRLTWWERGIDTGIVLASVNRDGRFAVAFSPEELASLRAGRTWLTVTVGNWLTEPRPSDTRIPVEKLASRPEATEPVAVAGPPTHYGRLLFEDGQPPVLDPKPWPGARIMIEFPYAGSVEPDAEGYFQVVLTPDQLAELRSRKPRKNVYIPSYGEQGRSTARYVYPVSSLAETKADAGVLKIPRPAASIEE